MPAFVKTKAEYDEILKNNAKVAIDFTASWCPPCKRIGPKFEAMAGQDEFKGIFFCKVDVDDNSDAAEAENISAMPTFKFYHNQALFATMTGANEEALLGNLKKLAEAV